MVNGWFWMISEVSVGSSLVVFFFKDLLAFFVFLMNVKAFAGNQSRQAQKIITSTNEKKLL